VTAKLVISSPNDNQLNDIANVFAGAFETLPDEQAERLKLSVGNAPRMGIGVRPVTRIEVTFENYTQQMIDDIAPLIEVISMLLNRQMEAGINVELIISDGDVRREFSK